MTTASDGAQDGTPATPTQPLIPARARSFVSSARLMVLAAPVRRQVIVSAAAQDGMTCGIDLGGR